jgi:hypothetical protein
MLMRIARWTLVVVFVAATAVTLTHRTSGYTGTSTSNGQYFAAYRSDRVEISRAEYDAISHRDPRGFWVGLVMIMSACCLGGLEQLRRSGAR